MRTERGAAILLLVCAAVGLATPLALGLTYGARLSTSAGLFRVPVADAGPPSAGLRGPRRTLVAVFDGLGHDAAQTMRSVAALRARGQCRTTEVGPLSMSRPVYAVLSTGLEADRTAVRGNEDAGPLAAQSVWALARTRGRTVSVTSELRWWTELFPDGFDAAATVSREEDAFVRAPAADVRLVHPLYVDETGHARGAASPAYAAAVARADAELTAALAAVDLEQDLVVVTADHGHMPRGGHGGPQAAVSRVLTCWAGRGVRRLADAAPVRATAVAPSLALLLGLPFPADMRAGDDELDAALAVVDPAAFPAGYLAERGAAVDRFRAANAAQLRAWLPASEGRWEAFAAAHRRRQAWRAAPLLTALAAAPLLQARAHRRRGDGGAGFGLGFVLATLAAAAGIQLALRGSFDLSSIAHREDFLGFTVAMSLACALAPIAVQARRRRDAAGLAIDLAALSAIGTLVSLAHLAAFGWQVGYPMPPPMLLFFPYFAAIFLGVLNGAGLVVAVAGLVRARR